MKYARTSLIHKAKLYSMDTPNIQTDAQSPDTIVKAPEQKKDVLAEILEWSKDRPAWQRDALRRLFTAGILLPADFDDLTDLAKSVHGLAPSRTPDFLKAEHIALKGSEVAPVSMLSVTHRRGVNALAPDQTVAFGPNLTIVYGPNAAGKSGYARILKGACRSRGVEDILGNVLSDETPLKPLASIRYRKGTVDVPLEWSPHITPSEALARVNVFDSHCAAVYLRDKTDVAFRPFGLDIFDKLSNACSEVRSRLEKEVEKLEKSVPDLPSLLESTRARSLIDTLTALTNVDEVRALATLSTQEEGRLKELRDQQRDFQSSDPKKRSRELKLKAQRFNLLAQHLEHLDSELGESAIEKLRTSADQVRVARGALVAIQRTALTPDLLPGTGDDMWRKMWDAVGGFSNIIYPREEFPVLKDGARCPFCQQSITSETAARLKHLAEYVSSAAQQELRRTEVAYSDRIADIRGVAVERNDVTLAVNEIAADDAQLAQRIRQQLDEAARIRKEITSVTDLASLPKAGIEKGWAAEVRAVSTKLENRTTQLDSEQTTLDPKLLAELGDLEARASLKQKLQGVLDEIDRKKRLAAYRQCIDDTATLPITRKGTELTKELVTDNLRNTFQEELRQLEFSHLAVEIQAAGGARGALFHRLVFTNAPGVAVSNVVSEGESRTLSLAAFLTELSTASSPSAIIFDDPVSSLDHVWRERIARRLVAEARTRQVIVFTHDLVFLRTLMHESERQQVPCEHQYVRREGYAGVCSPDLPWIAMPVSKRIGKLRDRWQAAEKLFRTSGPEAYEKDAKDIYGLLREAWEQAIPEVLLNEVVERYRPSVETQRLRYLHDIQESDCKAVEEGMTECSRWMYGHDHPAADATPFPSPAELDKRINDLENWVKAIRQRRKKQ